MTESNRYVMTGEIADLAYKYTQKGDEYAEVSVAVNGNTSIYPTKLRTFDSILVSQLHGASRAYQISVDVEERPGTYQGKSITYRNIVGITSLAEPSADAPAATPQAPTQAPTRQVDQGAEPAPWSNSIDERIAWNSAINNGANHVDSQGPWQGPDHAWLKRVDEKANEIYGLIRRGPWQMVVVDEPPAEPEQSDEQLKEDLFGPSGVLTID